MTCKHGLNREIVDCLQCEDEERMARVPKVPTMGQWDDFCAVFPVPFDQFEKAYAAMVAGQEDEERMGAGFGAALDLTREAVGQPALAAEIDRLNAVNAKLVEMLQYWCPETEPLINQFDQPSTAHRVMWQRAKTALAKAKP